MLHADLQARRAAADAVNAARDADVRSARRPYGAAQADYLRALARAQARRSARFGDGLAARMARLAYGG